MKSVIRYLLEGDGSVPLFVETGGFFPLGEELVGISVDETKRHLPATVHKLTKQNLIDRITLITPKHEDGSDLTAQEISDMANQFFADHGLE